jgi:hypothetical protein
VPCAGIVQEFTKYPLTTEFSGGANWSSLDLPSDPGARQEIEALTPEGTKPELGHAGRGRGRGAASVGWLDGERLPKSLGVVPSTLQCPLFASVAPVSGGTNMDVSRREKTVVLL